MELKNTIQAMQKLGNKDVREWKAILKREKKTTKSAKFKIFFRKSARVTELTFWSPNFMQKLRKIQ